MGWTPHSFAMPRLAPTILSPHSIGALELCHGSDGDGTLLDAENGYGFAEPILSSLWRGYPIFGPTPTWPKSTDICLSATCEISNRNIVYQSPKQGFFSRSPGRSPNKNSPAVADRPLLLPATHRTHFILRHSLHPPIAIDSPRIHNRQQQQHTFRSPLLYFKAS